MYTHHRVLVAGAARAGTTPDALQGHRLVFNVSLPRHAAGPTPRGREGAASPAWMSQWKGEGMSEGMDSGGGAGGHRAKDAERKTCRYEIHCMLVDTLPGLNLEDYDAFVASGRASTIHPCIR